MPIWIIQFVLYVAAFVLGLRFFFVKKSPLYFRLLFYAVICFLLEELYYLVDYACRGTWPDAFCFAAFGASAAYAFLFSANYGQFDTFVDDDSAGCRKADRIGILAPVVLAAVYVFAWTFYIRATGDVAYVILTVICKLPAFFAAYYHLKHLVLPDTMHFMVDSLRPCNGVCLAVILADFLSDGFFAFGCTAARSLCETVVAALLVLMMITAERGRKAWKI